VLAYRGERGSRSMTGLVRSAVRRSRRCQHCDRPSADVNGRRVVHDHPRDM